MQPIILRHKETGKVLAQGVIWNTGHVALEWEQTEELPPDLGPVFYPSVEELQTIYRKHAAIEQQVMSAMSEKPHQLVITLTAQQDGLHWHLHYADSRGYQGLSDCGWPTAEDVMAYAENVGMQICEPLDILPVLVEEVQAEQEPAVSLDGRILEREV